MFRVGDSRVLLELVLDAFRRGESAEAIVRSYRTLRLADVYAVISRYLADPAPFDEYLRRCDDEAATIRREMEAAGMTGGVSKEELLARARASEGAYRVIVLLVDPNFNRKGKGPSYMNSLSDTLWLQSPGVPGRGQADLEALAVAASLRRPGHVDGFPARGKAAPDPQSPNVPHPVQRRSVVMR
ncbi:MAG: hypothetical protein U0790_24785 [Isosphaeraceae bacterium]